MDVTQPVQRVPIYLNRVEKSIHIRIEFDTFSTNRTALIIILLGKVESGRGRSPCVIKTVIEYFTARSV